MSAEFIAILYDFLSTTLDSSHIAFCHIEELYFLLLSSGVHEIL
jgi:hypothetical protein